MEVDMEEFKQAGRHKEGCKQGDKNTDRQEERLGTITDRHGGRKQAWREVSRNFVISKQTDMKEVGEAGRPNSRQKADKDRGFGQAGRQETGDDIKHSKRYLCFQTGRVSQDKQRYVFRQV